MTILLDRKQKLADTMHIQCENGNTEILE